MTTKISTPKSRAKERKALLAVKAKRRQSRFSKLANGALSYAQGIMALSRYFDATQQAPYPQSRE